MQQPINERKLLKAYLLPRSFRNAGFTVLAIGLAAFLCVELSQWGVNVGLGELDYKGTMGIIAGTVILLGLACIAFAKEKDEDEYSLNMRMKAIGFAFMTGVSFIIMNTAYQFLSSRPLTSPDALPVLIGMMVLYLFSYYRQKRSDA